MLNDGSYIYLSNANESFRNATASGSIVEDTTTLGSGAALAGRLADVHSGVIDLTKA